MRLLIYMRDGRTVYYITGRAKLRQLLNRDPAHGNDSIVAARGIWNPVTGEYVWQPNIRLRHVAAGSISVVEEGAPRDAKDPA